MPQNQDEIAQLRAELTALKTEVAALKGTTPSPSTSDATPAVASSETTPSGAAAGTHGIPAGAPASSSAVDWDAALTKHNKEERDVAWSRLREPDLFTAAKAHIKIYGASLNGVRCKATSCLVTINVPKKPKAEYVPMANPWAGTDMFAHSKGIYSGRTLWSYLLTRHEKDIKEAGAERVNPAELAKKNPELVHAAVLVTPSAVGSETKPATTKSAEPKSAAKPAEPAKAVVAEPAKSTEPAKAAAVEAPKAAAAEAKPAAKPANKPSAAKASAPAIEAKPAAAETVKSESKLDAKVDGKPAAKAVEAKPAAVAVPAAAKPEVKAETKPADVKPAAAAATPAPSASAK